MMEKDKNSPLFYSEILYNKNGGATYIDIYKSKELNEIIFLTQFDGPNDRSIKIHYTEIDYLIRYLANARNSIEVVRGIETMEGIENGK